MSSGRRPRRFWYVIGAALITIGVLLGITVSVVVVIRQAGKAPTDDHGFGNNQTTTVHVDAGGSKAIYTNAPEGSEISCTARGVGLKPPVSP